MTPTQTEARDLQLADTVVFPSLGVSWNTAIVKKITESEVYFYRPYGTTADFSYTDGVLCYVGIEEFTLPRDSRLVTVVERKPLR